jgi:L,D-transpeptidase YcbB
MRIYQFFLLSLLILGCAGSQEKQEDPYDTATRIQDSVLQVKEQRFKDAHSATAENIRLIIESRQPGERYRALGVDLYSSVLLPKYYIESAFQPLWFPHYDSLDNVYQMLTFIENIEFHGLNPDHYHLPEIKEQLKLLNEDPQQIFDAIFLSNLDVLLSDAFFMLASHLYHGKVDPESHETQWGIRRNKPDLELDLNLRTMLLEKLVEDGFRQFYPPHPGYEAMVQEAQKIKDCLSEDFQVKVDAKVMPVKPGDSSQYISAVKEKLAFLNLYEPDSLTNTHIFDGKTAEAVKKLQKQFGLNTDGAIGPNTLKALNMPMEQRIRKLFVNMERLRWMPDSLETCYILVNIADFTLHMFHETDTLLSMRSIVGKNYRKTPVFNSLITYIVFSPSWTIPPGIMRNDLIPAVIRNPNYLTEKNMKAFDLQGNQVDPATINWKSQGMRYIVRQDPGPQNALGKVKFMFPNKHNVYLHDTPSRELFARDERTFSSGCIRIEKAFELTELLLSDMPVWSSDRIKQAMNSGREMTVVLKSPVGVYLYYLTAWGSYPGEIHYRSDIYERDDVIRKALGEKHSH